MLTAKTYSAAVTTASAAAKAYYDTDTLLMADAEYDALIADIEAFEAAHPDQAIDHGLTTTVAAGTSTGGTITHTTPMLSLEKAKDVDGIAKFVAAVGTPVTVTPKIDGLAITAHYENGVLTQAATRGDGVTGENITTQVLRAPGITGLPANVGDATFTAEVRGEVFMSADDFLKSNDARIAAGKIGYANPRNATAGAIRKETLEHDVFLSFAAYGVVTKTPHSPSHAAQMGALTSLGFTTAQSLTPDTSHGPLLTTPADVTAAINAIGEARTTLGFPTDGAVIAVDNATARAALGTGSRAPKWALAYKFAPVEATSILRDIEVSIGRTGRISLRGRIDPVAVDGSTVEYATLHNPAFIAEQGLGIGSRVMVVKAGDIIPRITATIGQQPADVTPWTPPTTCPQCDGPWDKSSLLWRCTSPECGEIPAITYAVGRDQLDADGMSEAIVTALVEADKVHDIADLFTLTVDDIATTPLGVTSTGATRTIGATVAKKIHAQIQNAKNAPLNKVVASLGLRKTGRTMSRRMVAKFGTMDALRAATVDDLATVDGIGIDKATIIHAEFQRMAPVIDRLAALGVNMGAPVAPAADSSDQPLAGKTVVVTGAMTGPLASLKRNDMNELIEAKGGKSSGSVSAKTSLLVCGEPGSSKHSKATSLGVAIVTPEEFAAMIGYTG